MNYVTQIITVTIGTQTFPDVPYIVAEGTGLGYYTEESGGTYLWPVGGGTVRREPPGHTRYVLTHLESHSGFGYWVYSEPHIRRWLELVAPLTDWTLPVDALVTRPDWPNNQQIYDLLRQAVQEIKTPAPLKRRRVSRKVSV